MLRLYPSTLQHRRTTRRLARKVLFGAAALLLFGLLSNAAHAGLLITPTFDSSITSDPNAAQIEATINQAISFYENTYSNPINVQILFKETTSGLGQTQGTFYDIGYLNFRNGLASNQAISGQADQATALAHLPGGSNNPVNGTSGLIVSSADGRALGYNTPGVYGTDGSFNNGGTLDGIISLNTSITFPPNANNGSNYSLLSVTEHEIDEVLGLPSSLGLFSNPTAMDLYRYDTNGVRNFTTSGDDAWFSIDGTNRLVQFNQDGLGDYGDWHISSTVRVQDAYGTPGTSPFLTDSSVEATALDVIGYNRTAASTATVPEPNSFVLLGTALILLAAFRHGRKSGSAVRVACSEPCV